MIDFLIFGPKPIFLGPASCTSEKAALQGLKKDC